MEVVGHVVVVVAIEKVKVIFGDLVNVHKVCRLEGVVVGSSAIFFVCLVKFHWFH